MCRLSRNLEPDGPVTGLYRDSITFLCNFLPESSDGLSGFRYRATDTPEWRTTKITNLGTNQKTVSNLSPGRTYEFMVLSQDRHGDGMFSKAIRVSTKGKSFICRTGQ